jgi:hypothetical protein
VSVSLILRVCHVCCAWCLACVRLACARASQDDASEWKRRYDEDNGISNTMHDAPAAAPSVTPMGTADEDHVGSMADLVRSRSPPLLSLLSPAPVPAHLFCCHPALTSLRPPLDPCSSATPDFHPL